MKIQNKWTFYGSSRKYKRLLSCIEILNLEMEGEEEEEIHNELLSKLRIQDGIRLAHLNINGLTHKLDELRLLIASTDLDVLALTETHLSNDIHDNELIIENYNILRNDRNNGLTPWGGTAIYFNESLSAHEFTSDHDIEATWIDITIKGQKLLVGSVYRPPKDNAFLQKFNRALNEVSHRSNIIVFGDFNIDISKTAKLPEPALTHSYKSILRANKLKNVITEYTRVTDSTKSLIDHVLASDCSKLLSSGTYDPCLSDHRLIFAVMKLKRQRKSPTFKTVKNYKNVDWKKVQTEMLETPWWVTSTFDDVDDSYWAWKSLYNQILSNHVKERKVKVRAESHPWMNSDIRKQMNHRYKLLVLAQKTNKGSLQWTLYKQARNKCTALLRKAKSDYWKNKFDNSTSTKEFWSLVKSFQGQQTRSKIGPIKDDGGKILTCDHEKSNTLNKYFATIGKKMSEPLPPPQPIEVNNAAPHCSPVIEIDRSDLSKQFKKLTHPSKASGIDNISARDLHSIGEPIIDSLMTIFNKSIDTLNIPSIWKRSKVKCLHKKGSKLECENYRPISLLSIPSKLMESIICRNLDYHLQSHNLLNEGQWGFRKQRSTILALLNMTEKWRYLLDNNHHVGILFLDYRKAFDSVNHEVIDHKLLKHGINGDLHKWIMNYLSERSQITVVNGKSSDMELVDTGVPQGSLIGPRAFTLTVNDCPDISEDFDTDLFADDNTSACSDKNLDTMFVKVQHMSNELSLWSSTARLSIHPLKSTLLVLSPKAFIGPLPVVTLDGVPLTIKKNAKCLGVKIDNKLSWKNHISSTTKLFGVKIKKLFKMRDMSTETLKSIYIQGILPSVTYALPVWGNGCKNQLDHLNDLHCKVARMIFRTGDQMSNSDVLNLAKFESIDIMYKRQLACLSYKLFKNQLPVSLTKWQAEKKTSRVLRNKHRVKLPSFNKVAYKKSFAYRSAVIWNQLSNETVDQNSLSCFKKKLSKDINLLSFAEGGMRQKNNDFIYY